MTERIDMQKIDGIANADQDKYIVHWREEIINILTALCKAGKLVTAYIGGEGVDFILTSIVAVKLEQNTVLLDLGTDAAANKRAMMTKKIVCVTELDGIRIQMSVEAFRPARFAERNVFAMTMPDTLLRLQRREYYRIDTPRFKPLLCNFSAADVKAGTPRQWVVADISCGGIAVVLPDTALNIESGTRFSGCRIALPEIAEVSVDLVIRGTVEIAFPTGVQHRHAGCEFVNMLERERSLIQRYVSKLEYERRYRAKAR
jgi:c-di-GMP-binding flagellar brake protein YcgR